MAENKTNKPENTYNKSQWDDMEKDDLIKQVKKQLLLLKKVKLKCDDLSQTNSKFEEALKTKSDECADFKAQMSTFQSENNNLKSLIAEREQDNLNDSSKIMLLNEQIECMLMKAETANATFTCLQQEIKTLQTKNENLAQEVKVVNSARVDAVALLNSREQDLKLILENQISEMKLKVDTLMKTQLDLQTLNDELANKNESLNELINEWQHRNNESDTRVSYLESELNQSAQRLMIQSNDYENKLKTYENSTLDLKFLETQINEYQTRLAEIDTAVENLSKNFGIVLEHSDVVSKLKACLTIHSSVNSNSTVNDVVRNMTNKIKDLENANYQFDEKINKSLNHLEMLEKKIDSVESTSIVQCSSVLSQTDHFVDELSENICTNLVTKTDKNVQVAFEPISNGINVETQTVQVLTKDAFTEESSENIWTDITKTDKYVQVAFEPKKNGINIDAQTVQMLTEDAFTETGSSDFKYDLQDQLLPKTFENSSTQTEAAVEIGERIETDTSPTNPDTKEIEKKLQDAGELVGKYKAVAVKAKREVAELKKKISDLSAEVQMIANERNSCQTRLEAVTVQLAIATKDRSASENSNKSLHAQLANEKEKLKNTIVKLEQALKEASKSNLISLEIADYEKLVGELNRQIENKDLEWNKSLSEIEVQKQAMKALETEIKELEMQNKQSEERVEQLKSFTAKLKEEILSLRNEERQWKTKENINIVQQEASSQEIENYKIQLSELVNDNSSLHESNRVLQEANQKMLRSSESRVAALTKELQTVKEEFSLCQSEYENYKIRVHSVFKQQKKNAIAGTDEINKTDDALEEKNRLSRMTEMLQTRVHELTAQLNASNSELESLQEEHQNLLQRHNRTLASLAEQESSWKQRFDLLQNELRSWQEEVKHVKQSERDLRKEMNISLHNEEAKFRKMQMEKVEEMQIKLDSAQDEIARLQRELIESRSAANSTVKDDDVPIDFINTERQEGEGSESTDTVFGAPYRLGSASLNHTNSSFIPFDQLINQDEKASIHSGTSVEIEKLESQLSVGMKKIDHLTEILNESEATNARLTEQTRVLKEEIRRLERNQEREQHLANLEYTKNIVIKFVSLPKCDERERLVPVLAKLLQLSPDEERQLHSFATTGILENNPTVIASGWSSYLPKWSGSFQ